MDNFINYFRGVPNGASLPHHLFLKRAQLCNFYFYHTYLHNTNFVWFQMEIPVYIIIRESDGMEVTFPHSALSRVYHGIMKRDKYFMYIRDLSHTHPQSVDYKYKLWSLPSLPSVLFKN